MNNSIDQQFIEYIVKSLVGKPEAVRVERRIDEKGVLLELTVDPEDLGRVIGKRGATAQSLRTLLRALGTKNDARYNLKIIDNGVAPATTNLNNDTATVPPASTGDDAAEPTATTTEEPTVAEVSEDVDAQYETGLPVAEKDQAGDGDDDVVSKTRKELAELDDLDV